VRAGVGVVVFVGVAAVTLAATAACVASDVGAAAVLVLPLLPLAGGLRAGRAGGPVELFGEVAVVVVAAVGTVGNGGNGKDALLFVVVVCVAVMGVVAAGALPEEVFLAVVVLLVAVSVDFAVAVVAVFVVDLVLGSAFRLLAAATAAAAAAAAAVSPAGFSPALSVTVRTAIAGNQPAACVLADTPKYHPRLS